MSSDGLPADVPDELARHPDYEVVRELGRGGMGVVYLVRNKLMHRLEVLKLVSREVVGRPGAADRFLREVRSAGQLAHPNIVTAYTALRLGDRLALAMEYVDGQNLADVVRTRGAFSIPAACGCARQAALGLQHAHEKGFVHRDIKPHNLILARQDGKSVVKILDFGLAKATSENQETNLTHTGQVLGTPAFLAPEQVTGASAADIRADIYALGCTLFFLLTGRPPFEGAGGIHSILYAHAHQAPPALDQVRPGVPADLAAVAARMMAKNPADRYQTPAEVAKVLTPFVKGGTTAAAPVSAATVTAAAARTAVPYPTAVAHPSPLLITPPTGFEEMTATGPTVAARARPRYPVVGLVVGLVGGAAAVAVLVAVLMCPGVINLGRPDRVTTPPTPPTENPKDPVVPRDPVVPKVQPAKLINENLTGWTHEAAGASGWVYTHLATAGLVGGVALANTPWRPVWTVEGGQIVGRTAGDGSDHYLMYDTEYADFVLRVDVRMGVGTNAGIVVRGWDGEMLPINANGNNTVPGHPVVKLYETSVFRVYRTGTTHWLKDRETFVEPDVKTLTPDGTWVTVEVDVWGENAVIKLDGVRVARLTAGPPARGALGVAPPGLLRPKGKVGFQVISGTVQFRNLQIEPR